MALPTASDNPFTSLLITEGTEPTAPAAGKQRLYIDSTSKRVMRVNSSGVERSIEPTWCYKTADESFSSTSYANSTNMGLAIAASRVYKYRFVIFYNTNATTVGIKLAIQGPASCLAYAGVIFPTGAGGSATNDLTIGSQVGASADISTDMTFAAPTVGPGATNVMVIVEGIVSNGVNAGTLQLRHASETATATTILKYSHGELWEM